MKILFMGTPDFAVPSLLRLISDGHEVVAAVTQPDKPRGRGHALTPSPVKVCAAAHGIAVHQPATLKDNALLPLLEAARPDLIAVVAYGKILPPYVLGAPPCGCVNVHASLLPKYRGAAPIERCIMEGETVTGVTTMRMAEGIDTGDMLLSAELAIGEYETAGELSERLSSLGAELLSKTVRALPYGISPRPQDHSLATYAPMIDKNTARLAFDRPPRDILNHIRGLSPLPGAFAVLDEKAYKFFGARIFDGYAPPAPPGTILFADTQNGLVLACAGGAVAITELLAPGTRRMTAPAYLMGHRLDTGKRFS